MHHHSLHLDRALPIGRDLILRDLRRQRPRPGALGLLCSRGIPLTPQQRLDTRWLPIRRDELRLIRRIQLDLPDLLDVVVTRQRGVLPPGPGGGGLEIDALGNEDVGFTGGLLGEGLGQILEERVKDLLLFVFGEVEAAFAEGFEHGALDDVLIDAHGDAVKVDDAAADVLRGPELGAFDAETAVADAAPGGVEHGGVLADDAFLLDLFRAGIDTGEDGVAPPFFGDVFAGPQPVETATFDKVAGVDLVQLFDFGSRAEAFGGDGDVALVDGREFNLRARLAWQ